jgi:hypothetical protein
MIQDQSLYSSAALASFRGSRVLLFELPMLSGLYEPALVAQAFPVDLCEGAAGDPEDPLTATAGTEHFS